MTVTTYAPHRRNHRLGRPPEPDAMRNRVSLSLSDDDYALMQAEAERAGMRLGALARVAVLRLIRERT